MMKRKRNADDRQQAFDWSLPASDEPQPAVQRQPDAKTKQSHTDEIRVVAPTSSYPPGHPWYYYHEGDNLPPVPVDDIPASLEAGRWLERDLTKNPAKREAALRKMLDKARHELAADKTRYHDIVTRGIKALSKYDREIAYGSNDPLAVASSLALKFNHVSIGLGRVAWLESELRHYTPSML